MMHYAHDTHWTIEDHEFSAKSSSCYSWKLFLRVCFSQVIKERCAWYDSVLMIENGCVIFAVKELNQ